MQYRSGDPPTTVPPPVTEPGGSVPAAQRPVNTLAIVSLAAGIAGYVLPHPFIGGLVAIITGHLARGQIRRTGEGGAGLATIGLVLGYLHLVLSVLLVGFIVLVILGFGAYVVSQGNR
jgi:Domain of unknown function (DUF4190)